MPSHAIRLTWCFFTEISCLLLLELWLMRAISVTKTVKLWAVKPKRFMELWGTAELKIIFLWEAVMSAGLWLYHAQVIKTDQPDSSNICTYICRATRFKKKKKK